MKTINIITLAFFFLSGVLFFLYSCSDDDENFAAPTVTLSTEALTQKVGETLNVTLTINAPAGLEKIVIKKLLDGIVESTQNVTSIENNTYEFQYTIEELDAEGILSFSFTAIDKKDQEGSKDLVVEVELSVTQFLLKYDWLLTEEVRVLTSENDISDEYTDDVYRFNADGTYQKSIGEKQDAFNDLWYNYCYWNLNEDTQMLIMTRTGAFGGDVRDTLSITSIDAYTMEANVIYRGLDAFNDGTEVVPYESAEDYIKKYAAQSKGSTFDPYLPGADDDETGPAGYCNSIEW